MWLANCTGKEAGAAAKRFCSDTCRNGFDSDARRWVHQAIAAGMLSVETIRKATSSPCTAPGGVAEAADA